MKRIRALLFIFLCIAGSALQAVASVEPPELVNLRTETAKFYPAKVGQTKGEFFSGPVHYTDTAGKWQEIAVDVVDLNRVSDTDDGLKRFDIATSEPITASYDEIGLPESPGGRTVLSKKLYAYGVLRNKYGFLAPRGLNGHFVMALDGNERIAFKALNAKNGTPLLNGNGLLYQGAWPGVDLQYKVTPSMLKENIIISAPGTQQKFSFKIRAVGLQLRRSESNLLEFVANDGSVRAVMPLPFMQDANGETSTDVKSTVTLSRGWATLELDAGGDWLNDPKRAFPIVLDPTATTSIPTQDAHISEGNHDEKLGSTELESLDAGVWRGIFVKHAANWILLKFDLSTLPINTHIHSSDLKMYCYDVQGDTGNMSAHTIPYSMVWNEGTVTWDSLNMSLTQPADPSAASLPNVEGYWTKAVDPATVKALVENPTRSILLWTDSPEGYIRRFYSKDSGTTANFPKLTVYFSHIPNIVNATGAHPNPLAGDPLYSGLGVREALRYIVNWETSFPYDPAHPGTNFPCAGRAEINGVNPKVSVDTVSSTAHQVEFRTYYGPTGPVMELKPNSLYSVKIYSWCTRDTSCYDPADDKTYAAKPLTPSFDTNLMYSHECSGTSLSWHSLANGHEAPQASNPGAGTCTFQYTTNTYAHAKVYYWKHGDSDPAHMLSKDEPIGGNGYIHSVTLAELSWGTIYDYKVETSFGWDTAGTYKVTSATGQFATTQVTYNVPSVTSVEANPPLVDSTVTWQTGNIQTDGVLYLGLTPESVDRTLRDPNTNLTYNHTVKISGLSPGVTYYYRVGCKDSAERYPAISGAPLSFTTPKVARGTEAYLHFTSWSLGSGGQLAVNTANGNLVVGQSLLSLAGRGPKLIVGFTYNRNAVLDNSVLGPGWRMIYDSTLTFDRLYGYAVQTHDDGSTHVFSKNSGGFAAACGEFSKLEPVAETGDYRVTYKDGTSYIYRLVAGVFRLCEIRDRFGRGLIIDRDTAYGRIRSLRRSASDAPEVSFSYDSNGYLDYVLTKVDPATGKQYKVNVTVTPYADLHGVLKWAKVQMTTPYDASTVDEHWTTYNMDYTSNNTYVASTDGSKVGVVYWPDLCKVNVVKSAYTYYGETGTTRSAAVAELQQTFEYTADGVCTVIDGRGYRTQYAHNTNFTLRNVSHPNGATESYMYNGQYQVAQSIQSKVSGLNVTTRYDYDANGNLIALVEDDTGTDANTVDTTTAFTYESKYNQLLTVTDPRQYKLDPNTVSVQYGYDPVNGTLTSIEPKGSGSLKPANYRVELAYDKNFSLQYKKVYNTNPNKSNALGTTTYEYGYDAFGQPEAIFYIENGQRRLIGFYRYDMFGKLLYAIDANSSVLRNIYDNHGQLARQTRPLNLSDNTHIDNSAICQYVIGRLSAGYGFALQNVVLNEPYPDFTYSKQYIYDVLGRVTTETDAMGRNTTYEYDELNRLVKVVCPIAAATTIYHYDQSGNLEWKRYPVQDTFAIVRHYYDAVNMEYMSKDPSIGAEYEFRREFDLAGNIVAFYRGWNESTGTYAGKMIYVYDNLNRPTQVQYFSASGVLLKTVNTDYDRNGNPVQITEPVFSQTGVDKGTLHRDRVYSTINQLAEETITPSATANASFYSHATYEYGGGKLLEETLQTSAARRPSVTTNYVYDAASRLKVLSDDLKTFSFAYYPNGARKSVTYGNAMTPFFMTANYTYDRVSRLTNLAYGWKAGTAQLNFGYTYYEDGRVKSVTETGSGVSIEAGFVDQDDKATPIANYKGTGLFPAQQRTVNYTYDDLGRLKSASLPSYCNITPKSSYSWGYDAMGNRTAETISEEAYSYPVELTNPETDEPYDSTVYCPARTQTTSYTFNPATGNRVHSAGGSIAADYKSTFATSYSYDSLGNQISQSTTTTDSSGWQTISTVTSMFNELWMAAGQTITQPNERPLTTEYYYDSNGVQLGENSRVYHYGSNGITAIDGHRYTRENGLMLASDDGFYYIVNGHGDVVALISDSTGDVLAYYVYDPEGGLRAAQSTGVFNKFKFAGGLQSQSGNYVFGARLYAPGEGRWISMDAFRGSISDPMSLNRYAYCGNDPVNYADPSGHAAEAGGGGGASYHEDGQMTSYMVSEDGADQFEAAKSDIHASKDAWKTWITVGVSFIKAIGPLLAPATDGAIESTHNFPTIRPGDCVNIVMSPDGYVTITVKRWDKYKKGGPGWHVEYYSEGYAFRLSELDISIIGFCENTCNPVPVPSYNNQRPVWPQKF